MKKVNSIFAWIVLLCLCILSWVNVFIWHNIYLAIVFTAEIFIWLWLMEKNNNEIKFTYGTFRILYQTSYELWLY